MLGMKRSGAVAIIVADTGIVVVVVAVAAASEVVV